MDFTYASVDHMYFKEKVEAWNREPVRIWCDYHLPHAAWHLRRIELIKAVYCGLWNVVPVLLKGCAKLLILSGTGTRHCTRRSRASQNRLNGWYVWWVCRPWKNWDIFSFQKLFTDPCKMGLSCIIMLKHEVDGGGWMALQWASGSRHSVSVNSNCRQWNAIVFIVLSLCLPIP